MIMTPLKILNEELPTKFFSTTISREQKDQLKTADAHLIWSINYIISSFIAQETLGSPTTQALLSYYAFFHGAYGLICLDLRSKRFAHIKHRTLLKRLDKLIEEGLLNSDFKITMNWERLIREELCYLQGKNGLEKFKLIRKMPRVGIFKTEEAVEKKQTFFIPKNKVEWTTFTKMASAYRIYLILLLAEIIKILNNKPFKFKFYSTKIEFPKVYYKEFFMPHFGKGKKQLAGITWFSHLLKALQEIP